MPGYFSPLQSEHLSRQGVRQKCSAFSRVKSRERAHAGAFGESEGLLCALCAR
jgi:hypothetical protein